MDERTPGWGALDAAGRLLRPQAPGGHAYEHLTDDELIAELDRARRGEPSDVAPYPLTNPSTPTGFEHLTDAELLRQLTRARASLLGELEGGK